MGPTGCPDTSAKNYQFTLRKNPKHAPWWKTGVARVVFVLDCLRCDSRDGFGGLVVSMLASGTRVHGFKHGQSRWIFRTSKKSSACLPSEGKWKNLSHIPALRHVKEPSTSVNYECASKIPCIVPSFSSRGPSCLRGAWCLWRLMRRTHWGQGYNRPTGCSGENSPHATFTVWLGVNYDISSFKSLAFCSLPLLYRDMSRNLYR